MKKTNKILGGLLTFVIVICVELFFNFKEVSAATKTSVEFINVATKANTNQKYKGDAILIEYKNKYFLVDTGYGFAYGSSSDPLTKRLNSLVAKGKYLSGIIITHSHKDHYGALSKILNNKVVRKGSVKNGGTTIYYNNIYVDDELNSALTKAKNKGITIQAVKKGSICNAYTGNTNTYATARENNGLYVYGAAWELRKKDAYNINQASMVVQLKSDKLKAILLSDLQIRGLNDMKNKYEKNIMSIDYDICKVGHHGLRTMNTSEDGVDSEIDNYYKIFNAEHYIFTTYKSMAESSKYQERHSYLKKKLSKIGKTYYSSSNDLQVFEK